MGRVEVNGDILIYAPGSKCVEILDAVKKAGIGNGLEIDCVVGSVGVIGVELRYSCVYGGTFRRAMARPHPGGMLSISLEALRKKYAEMLKVKAMYMEVGKTGVRPLTRVLNGEV